ncbi:MAG: FKBP-type peptidyl-prolyl cis-trans isomerase [Chlamydiales bacterium]|nr:FKBP-type peptidyl-prolyl cis-trans isomerase [Chlamydiales bacterium]
MVINIPLFHQVVNENLSLFQYVLGPTVSSQTLLDALLSNRQTLYSLLKGDKVLIGIILGYGKQNALYISRMENIQEAMDEDVPPFLPNAIMQLKSSQEYLPFSPAFGFKSVLDEMNALERLTTTSSPKLITKSPQFIFGWIKDSKNSQKIISELEASQDLIHTSFLSPLSLEKVLLKFGKKNYTSGKGADVAMLSDVNELVARAIWEVAREYDADYFSYFLAGMETLEYKGQRDRLARFPDYRRTFLEARANLKEADLLFEKLALNSSFNSLIPSKLCYRITKNGNGEPKCNGSNLSLSYSIFSPNDLCLATEKNVMLNLKNTIPGFAAGIIGMQIGETREIYIHPSLAYGFNTSLDKCIFLRAVVQLHQIHDNREFDPNMSQLDLDFIKSNDHLRKVEDDYKKAVIERAVDLARYLKKNDKLDLDRIKKHLESYHETRDIKSPMLTEDQRDIVNLIHWGIYFSPRLHT